MPIHLLLPHSLVALPWLMLNPWKHLVSILSVNEHSFYGGWGGAEVQGLLKVLLYLHRELLYLHRELCQSGRCFVQI